MSYYKRRETSTSFVRFRLLDKAGGEINSYSNYACYSPVTYAAIPKECVTIECFHPLNQIPYDMDAIKRWIDEINLLGFPCHIVDKKTNKTTLTVALDLKDYRRKMHVNCALQLVRCLIESGIFHVPDLYLSKIDKLVVKMDKDDRAERFLMLQDAHREIRGYANTNHMCTYASNGDGNVDRQEFFNRLEKYSAETYSGTVIGLSALWCKTYDKNRGRW